MPAEHKFDCIPGFVYAVGGYDGSSRQCLSSVERYNPLDDTWVYVAEMSCRRSGAGRLEIWYMIIGFQAFAT